MILGGVMGAQLIVFIPPMTNTHLSISKEGSETKALASFSAPLSPILLFSKLKVVRESGCQLLETSHKHRAML